MDMRERSAKARSRFLSAPGKKQQCTGQNVHNRLGIFFYPESDAMPEPRRDHHTRGRQVNLAADQPTPRPALIKVYQRAQARAEVAEPRARIMFCRIHRPGKP